MPRRGSVLSECPLKGKRRQTYKHELPDAARLESTNYGEYTESLHHVQEKPSRRSESEVHQAPRRPGWVHAGKRPQVLLRVP